MAETVQLMGDALVRLQRHTHDVIVPRQGQTWSRDLNSGVPGSMRIVLRSRTTPYFEAVNLHDQILKFWILRSCDCSVIDAMVLITYVRYQNYYFVLISNLLSFSVLQASSVLGRYDRYLIAFDRLSSVNLTSSSFWLSSHFFHLFDTRP